MWQGGAPWRPRPRINIQQRAGKGRWTNTRLFVQREGPSSSEREMKPEPILPGKGLKEGGNSCEKINHKKKRAPTSVLYRHHLSHGFLTLFTTAAFLFARERKPGTACESVAWSYHSDSLKFIHLLSTSPWCMSLLNRKQMFLPRSSNECCSRHIVRELKVSQPGKHSIMLKKKKVHRSREPRWRSR